MKRDTKAKIDGMTPQEQEDRLMELNGKLGVTNPYSTSGGNPPPVQDLDEFEEREYLKQKLGYSNPHAPSSGGGRH